MGLTPNTRYIANALDLVPLLEKGSVKAAFFDPQYRGLLTKLGYGNEGARQETRINYPQMGEELIQDILKLMSDVLQPSGHIFLWVDKFHLVEGSAKKWVEGTDLHVVDMIVWDKTRIGMGYRSRSRSEYLIIIQKEPKKARMTGVWKDRGIPDVWAEKVPRVKEFPHIKPIGLTKRLIECVSEPGDIIIDPASGSYVTFEATKQSGRTFYGGDLLFGDVELTSN